MPTFLELKQDVYRRTGFASSPDSVISTRIGAFINEVQQDILAEPGMEYLLNDSVTFASVADQQTYGLPPEVSKIKVLTEATNRVQLFPMSLDEYRRVYPDPSAVTGTSNRWVDLGFDAGAVEPSDASTIFIVSTSASDNTQTAYLEGFITGGYPFTASVALTGATAVSFTPTTVISITKLFLSAAAVGTITLREDSGTGTTLATIPVAGVYSRYRRIALAPTPSTAITYTVQCVRTVTDMVQDNDQPIIPYQFHRILAIGARTKEYEKVNDTNRLAVARVEYTKELKALKFWLYDQSAGTPNMRAGSFRSALPRVRTV